MSTNLPKGSLTAKQVISHLSDFTLAELATIYKAIWEESVTRKDGFFYIGLIAEDGIYRREVYNNLHQAEQAIYDSIYGESYLITVYTDNQAAGDLFQHAWKVEDVPLKYVV